MKLEKFKEGDIIQRTRPNRFGDHSFLCEPLEFLEFRLGVILLREAQPGKDSNMFTLNAFTWNDSNWDYYPLEILSQEYQKRSEHLRKSHIRKIKEVFLMLIIPGYASKKLSPKILK